MKKYNVLAIGEVLFDVINNEYKLGGAPFNVAAHMSSLGHRSHILSAVGVDELGDRIFREARKLHVNTDLIYRNHDRPTGTVQVTFQDDEPEYVIVENVAWDYLQADFSKLMQKDWSVVAFGSLAQRSAHNLAFYHTMFEILDPTWRYFDCNLRQNYYNRQVIEDSLRYANISKFNENEIKVISQLLYHKDLNPVDFAENLHKSYGIEIVVYTWGKEGSRAWHEGHYYSKGSIPVRTADTIGAGDAFSAGFLHSWIQGSNVEAALEDGNRLGGYVASKSGAIPLYDEELRAYFEL